MLKYRCCMASGAEILSVGTTFSISWARSSVLYGSCSNLIQINTGRWRTTESSDLTWSTCGLLDCLQLAQMKDCHVTNVCISKCVSRLACVCPYKSYLFQTVLSCFGSE